MTFPEYKQGLIYDTPERPHHLPVFVLSGPVRSACLALPGLFKAYHRTHFLSLRPQPLVSLKFKCQKKHLTTSFLWNTPTTHRNGQNFSRMNKSRFPGIQSMCVLLFKIARSSFLSLLMKKCYNMSSGH